MQDQAWNPEEEINGKETPVSLEAMDGLIKEYLQKRQDYEEAKKVSTEKYHTYEQAEHKIILALKAANKKSYKVDGVGTFSIVFKEVVTTPKTLEAKRQLISYIREKYGADVCDEMLSINHQTLNSFYNQEAEKCEDRSLFVLPGLEAPTVKENASFRKG